MNLIDNLLGEHALLYMLFATYAENDRKESGEEANPKTLQMLAQPLLAHAKIEEDLLFPALEQKIGPAGPLQVMRMEHDQIDTVFQKAIRGEAIDRPLVSETIELARQHFAKEEQVLFPLARQVLPTSQLEDLGRKWADLRRVRGS